MPLQINWRKRAPPPGAALETPRALKIVATTRSRGSPLSPQALNDIPIVNNFLPHVNRSGIFDKADSTISMALTLHRGNLGLRRDCVSPVHCPLSVSQNAQRLLLFLRFVCPASRHRYLRFAAGAFYEVAGRNGGAWRPAYSRGTRFCPMNTSRGWLKGQSISQFL